MENAALNAGIPVIGLACNVIFQIACVRFFQRGRLLRSIYSGFLAGSAAVCAAQVVADRGAGLSTFSGDVIANLVIHATLGYCYFHFINLSETGRRARLLRELYESQDGLTLDELLSRYSSREMLRVRLDRLRNNGQILLEGGRYRLGTPTVAWMDGAILWLKRAILGRSSEFES